jgi:hypothetical protein
MGHVASRFAPLDPDLEAENQLLDFVPQLWTSYSAKFDESPNRRAFPILLVVDMSRKYWMETIILFEILQE